MNSFIYHVNKLYSSQIPEQQRVAQYKQLLADHYMGLALENYSPIYRDIPI